MNSENRGAPQAAPETEAEYDLRVLRAIVSLERQGKLPCGVKEVAAEVTRLRVAEYEEAMLRA